MTQITVNGEVSRQLAEARERIEVRDSKGQFLGFFQPGLCDADLELFKQLQQDGYPLTLDEYRRGIQEVRRAREDSACAEKWKTTDQIMAILKSLP